MRYNIHGRLIYDAMDGTLTLPGSDEADSQLSITANALLWFFLRHTEVVSRDEVLKKVWDDNGLTSSNSNLNQYLSMLRKTFRHYDIDNIIVTVSRGLLQLNPDLTIEMLDASPEPEPPLAAEAEPDPAAAYTSFCLEGDKKAPGDNYLITGWHLTDACEIWLEALKRTGQGHRIDVLPAPPATLAPEILPERKWLLVTTGKLSPARQKQVERWQQQVVSLEIVAL